MADLPQLDFRYSYIYDSVFKSYSKLKDDADPYPPFEEVSKFRDTAGSYWEKEAKEF